VIDTVLHTLAYRTPLPCGQRHRGCRAVALELMADLSAR
jgi:hypothetical protein